MKPRHLTFRSHLIGITLALSISANAQKKQKFVPNYDEETVPSYTLPDPLALPGGGTITNKDQWETQGRPATLKQFEEHVYGRAPQGKPPGLHWKLDKEEPDALGGIAIRREYVVTFGAKNGPEVRLLLYIPKDRSGPAPGFIGLNFRGNQRVEADPAITMESGYVIGSSGLVQKNRPTEKSRGTGATRWPAKMIVQRGYALATACCGNIDPDFHDGFKNGVHPIFPTERDGSSWGSISAWAWGLSRLLDVLEEIEEVDAGRIAVIGHSRLGKTSLWAGASDPRFALVISNNSGCGGAALSRRAVGETVGRINSRFPHWFCGNFQQFNNNEGALPVDQHQLIALIAPRPVYIASATGDRWADPRGEFLSLRHAAPVYALFQKDPLGVDKMPAPDQSTGSLMRYHLRTGTHDLTKWDWEQYMNFADQWMGKGG